MTPHAVSLVQSSFREVAANAAVVADLFYDRLFLLAPGVRPLFPEEMGEQKRKLVQMLALVVNGLARPEAILPAARELGRRHRGYGAEPAHYAVVGEALIWTLERGLGDAFTAETREAWAAAFAMLSGVMIEAQMEARAA
jgi:hemoglobin-like flavoprotein